MKSKPDNEESVIQQNEKNFEKITKSLLLILRDAEAANKPKPQQKQMIKKKIIEDGEDAH